jgi:hypothetical protein
LSRFDSDSDSSSSEVSSEAYVISNDPEEDSASWFADSGATESMTDKRHWFTTFEPIGEYIWSVTIADNRRLWVRGIGNILVDSFINGEIVQETLKNVLYVPGLCKNLLSISQLMDLDIAVIFIRRTCKMISHGGKGRLIFTGCREFSLWRLNITSHSPTSSANVATTSTTPLQQKSASTSADHLLR